MWFCAHAIHYFKLINRQQDSYLIHENVYLIDAQDADAAALSAETIAKANEDFNEDGHLELNEQKVAYLYAGLRKIVEVAWHPLVASVPGLTGLELSYSVLEVDTLDEVLDLSRGEMVNVLYRE